MESKIKSYFEKLNPIKLGLEEKIKVDKIEKLGKGLSSLNYLVNANDKKFVFRLKVDEDLPSAEREFKNLKFFQNEDFAPKVYLFDDSKKEFKFPILILSYLDGETIKEVKGFGKDQIEGLAEFLIKIHSMEIVDEMNNLPKKDYNEMVKKAERQKEVFGKYCKDEKFAKMMDNAYADLLKKYDNYNFPSEIVLAHGDFCSVNVLFNQNKYYLIDFEDLELSDPACEIAHIFIDFGTPFDEKNKKIFLDKYLEFRSEKNLKERVEKYAILWFLSGMYWGFVQLYKTLNNSFLEEYKEKKDVEIAISNEKIFLKKLIKMGVISEAILDFDFTKIF
ncbi:MAG: aminoglycoside phosphotransferase family protein [archaeon]